MGGGISRFPSKFSRLTVSKNFVGEPFCFSKDFWYGKKIRDMRGVSRFSVENFLSNLVGKIRSGGPLCFKKNLISKIFTQKRLGVKVRTRGWASRFCHSFFVSQCRKTSCGKFLVWIKSLWVRSDRGGRRFLSKFLSHRTEPNNFVK